MCGRRRRRSSCRSGSGRSPATARVTSVRCSARKISGRGDDALIGGVTAADAHRTIEAVWMLEAPQIIAGLTRMVGDVGLAEEFAQDALVAALEQWSESGVPPNPGAGLMVVAKRRAIDRVRRLERLEGKHQLIGYELQIRQEIAGDDLDAALDNEVGDDLLRLMFIACHPVLSAEARVALTLRLLGGLTTEEIARAFLTSESAIAQRIVRAKRTLADKHIPFEVPPEAERAARLSSVLEAIYLVFNEGYAATAGEDWMRPALCQEALRLGRVLAGLAADEPEVHGLVALMEIQTSRLAARTGPPGAYVLQAAIAACHARARTGQDTDWVQIAALYGALAQLMPSPVVRLNQAIAVAMTDGPAMGLERVDALTGEPAFKGYHLLPSVRGDLLVRACTASSNRLTR